MIFWICRSCDRGQQYCSERCRQKTRRQQRREANRCHQQSPEGRLDHRDHQRAYRQRQAWARVTDQGSQTDFSSGTIPPSELTTSSDLLICGSGLLGGQEVLFFWGKEVTRFRSRLVSFVVVENNKVPFTSCTSEFIRRKVPCHKYYYP